MRNAQTTPVLKLDPLGSGCCAAIFDLDDTLARGSALVQIARGMIWHGLAARRQVAGFGAHEIALRRRRQSHRRIDLVTQATATLVAGLDVKDLEFAGGQIYHRRLSRRLNQKVMTLINAHLNAGHRVWLATPAPVELATIIARNLGLDGAIGTVCEREDGRFTGRISGSFLYGKAKADALSDVIAREGLTPAKCYAYADSIDDLPMLAVVGHPAAVNPDRRLRQEAREHRWPVYDVGFRHDRAATTHLPPDRK